MSQPRMPTMLQAAGAALLGRAVLVLTGVASSILLPLVLDSGSVGIFFLAQIIIAGLSTVGQLGLAPVIPGAVTAALSRGESERARHAAVRIFLLALPGGIAAGVLATVAGPMLARAFAGPDAASWWTVALAIGVTVPFTSQFAVLLELLRATHAIRAAANLAGFSGLAIVLLAGYSVLADVPLEILDVLLAGAFGAAISTLAGSYLLFVRVLRWPSGTREPRFLPQTLHSAIPNLASMLALFSLSQIDILLLYLWTDTHEVALYGIALRFSALLVMPLAIANSALAPLAAGLRARNQMHELQSLLRKVAAASTLLAALPYAAFAVAGQWLIEVWHPDYLPAYRLVLILGIGQIVHAACGASGMLLMTSGDQLSAMRITLMTGMLTVLFCVAGLNLAGPAGLAVGSALGNVLQVLAFARRVRTRFKLDPTLLSLLYSPLPASRPR